MPHDRAVPDIECLRHGMGYRKAVSPCSRRMSREFDNAGGCIQVERYGVLTDTSQP